MISSTSPTTAQTLSPRKDSSIAKLLPPTKKVHKQRIRLQLEEESEVSDDEDTDSGLGENVAFAHLFPGLSQQPPALVVETPTTVFERIISRPAIDASSTADIHKLQEINQNPDVNNFLTQLQIFQSINAPTAQHIKNKSDLIKTLVESYFVNNMNVCCQFIITTTRDAFLLARPQLAEVFTFLRTKTVEYLNQELVPFNPADTEVIQVQKFETFLNNINGRLGDPNPKILQAALNLLLDPKLNRSINLRHFYSSILQIHDATTILEKVLRNHLFKGDNDSDRQQHDKKVKTIFPLIASLLENCHLFATEENPAPDIRIYFIKLVSDTIDSFYSFDKTSLALTRMSASNVLIKELEKLKSLSQVRKNLSSIDAKRVFSCSSVGILGVIGYNLFNDGSSIVTDTANYAHNDGLNSVNNQAWMVSAFNLIAGGLAALTRQYGRLGIREKADQDSKLSVVRAKTAFDKLSDAEKGSLSTATVYQAKKFKVIEKSANIVLNEDNVQFVSSIDTKALMKAFLKNKKNINTEFKPFYQEIKNKYGAARLNDFNNDINFTIFKLNGFRGTFFQHLLKQLDKKNALKLKEYWATEFILSPAVNQIAINTIFAQSIDTPIQECNMDLINALRTANYTQAEKLFYRIRNSFNSDRVLTPQLRQVLYFGITQNALLTKEQKLNFFNRLKKYQEIGRNGQGALAADYEKRNLLWLDTPISIGCYGLFDMKQITETYTTTALDSEIAIGAGKWFGIGSFMGTLLEWRSFGSTTTSDSSEFILDEAMLEVENQVAQDNEDNTLTNNIKLLAERVSNAQTGTLRLTDQVGENRPTIQAILNSIILEGQADLLQSTLHDMQCQNQQLIFMLVNKLANDDNNVDTDVQWLIKNCYPNASIQAELSTYCKEKYADDALFARLPIEEKFKLLSSMEINKRKNSKGVVSCHQAEIIVIKVQAYLRHLETDPLSDAYGLQECRAAYVKLINSAGNTNGALRALQRESMNATLGKKASIRGIGAAQMGAASVVGIAIVKGVIAGTLIAGISATGVGGIIIAAVVLGLFISCAIRWYSYKYSDGFNYSAKTDSNLFAQRQAEKFKPPENHVEIARPQNRNQAYISFLHEAEDKELALHKIIQNIFGHIAESDIETHVRAIQINIERIIEIMESDESGISNEIKSRIITGLLQEIEMGTSVFEAPQLQTCLNNIPAETFFGLPQYTFKVFFAGGCASAASIANVFIAIFVPPGISEAVTFGVDIGVMLLQTAGDVLANKYNSSLHAFKKERAKSYPISIAFLKSKWEEINPPLEQVVEADISASTPLLGRRRNSNPILIPIRV